MIVVKLLSEKGETDRPNGRLTVGILIFQEQTGQCRRGHFQEIKGARFPHRNLLLLLRSMNTIPFGKHFGTVSACLFGHELMLDFDGQSRQDIWAMVFLAIQPNLASPDLLTLCKQFLGLKKTASAVTAFVGAATRRRSGQRSLSMRRQGVSRATAD